MLFRSGDYEQAEQIYEDLDGYKDSAERIIAGKLAKIRSVMAAGNYQQAMEMLEEVRDRPEYDEYLADCIYSLGVLAFNNNELDKAWSYVQQLEQTAPSYSKLPQLRQYCHYSFGNRAAVEAAGLEDAEARIRGYVTAIEEFQQTENYADSEERITECRYRIAVEIMNQDQLTEAIETFAELGDYKQSEEYRCSCMLRYAQQHLENTDELSMTYLEELSRIGYEGAQELLDRYTGSAFSFHITNGPVDSTAQVTLVNDLAEVYLFYTVESMDENGAVPVLVRYLLPDGRQGRGLLNNDHSASGSKSWASLFPTDCTVSGEVTLEFYDAQRSELQALDTIRFNYTYTPPAPPETDPTEEEPPEEIPTGKSSGTEASAEDEPGKAPEG